MPRRTGIKRERCGKRRTRKKEMEEEQNMCNSENKRNTDKGRSRATKKGKDTKRFGSETDRETGKGK